jgi:hypothetical protein
MRNEKMGQFDPEINTQRVKNLASPSHVWTPDAAGIVHPLVKSGKVWQRFSNQLEKEQVHDGPYSHFA